MFPKIAFSNKIINILKFKSHGKGGSVRAGIQSRQLRKRCLYFRSCINDLGLIYLLRLKKETRTHHFFKLMVSKTITKWRGLLF